MQVMLCQSDLILLHKWGLDDSQSHTTVFVTYVCSNIAKYLYEKIFDNFNDISHKTKTRSIFQNRFPTPLPLQKNLLTLQCVGSNPTNGNHFLFHIFHFFEDFYVILIMATTNIFSPNLTSYATRP